MNQTLLPADDCHSLRQRPSIGHVLDILVTTVIRRAGMPILPQVDIKGSGVFFCQSTHLHPLPKTWATLEPAENDSRPLWAFRSRISTGTSIMLANCS